ncbi:Cupin domain protein [Paraliobacillus sp. PM-2]|uniref:cupin domain-containing protein n=1 Tax=Paraliobacillus sp. PM-2 TaxID=1462524 RepID=UPI00061BC291|nr:cupin domain-containing protein [Paraliobacillus sp. PM-2]CQR46572.1 Cupin domain protein [Paraliobacillus sp. PM-2]
MEKANLKSYITYDSNQFTKRIVFKDQSSTAFVLNFQPGQTLPAHKHPGSTVYLQVLTGSGEFTIDNQTVKVEENDLLAVEEDEELAFANTGEQLTSLYVVLTKIPNEAYAKDI